MAFSCSWPYSADRKAPFVDGFHTGFILQSLKEYTDARGADVQIDTALPVARGFAFFQEHLVSPDGLPRYYADREVKPDGQNFAQFIQTLAVCTPDEAALPMAEQAWKKMIRMLPLNAQDGLPGSRRYDRGMFDQDYPQLRWRTAPAALATAHLIGKLEQAAAAPRA